MSQISNNSDRRGPLQLNKNKKNMNKSGLPVAIASPEGNRQQPIIIGQIQLPNEPIIIDDNMPANVTKQSNNKNSQSINKVSNKNGHTGDESHKISLNGSNNKNSTPAENGNNKKATNGSNKVEEKSEPIVVPAKDSPKVRESPRKAAESNGINKDSIVDLTVGGPEVQIVPPPQVTTPPKKQEAEPKKLESPVVVAVEKTPERASKSLLNENDIRGIDSEGFEMEPLVIDGSEYEDSPIPSKLIGSAGKISRSAGPSRSRISPFRRSERLQNTNTSTIVNLSTVSEQSSEHINLSNSDADKSYSESLKFISGRKSTRPLKDINLSYRKSALNTSMDSNSSMNVTIGSEIPNDSFRTPFFGRKRKENGEEEEEEVRATDSPKRARLDFSGFLGVIASPVSMLKNKFSRAKIQPTSTPNKDGKDANNDSIIEELPIAIATDESVGEIQEAVEGDAVLAALVVERDGASTSDAINVVNEENAAEAVDDMEGIEIREISDRNTSRCNMM